MDETAVSVVTYATHAIAHLSTIIRWAIDNHDKEEALDLLNTACLHISEVERALRD